MNGLSEDFAEALTYLGALWAKAPSTRALDQVCLAREFEMQLPRRIKHS